MGNTKNEGRYARPREKSQRPREENKIKTWFCWQIPRLFVGRLSLLRATKRSAYMNNKCKFQCLRYEVLAFIIYVFFGTEHSLLSASTIFGFE